MKNKFSLEVNKPCLENFKNFAPTSNGGFCGACKKEVIDFTKMDSQQIISYFKNRSNQDTCGKFSKNQLKTYNETLNYKTKYNLVGALGLALLSLFTSNTTKAQETNTVVSHNSKNKIQQDNLTVLGNVSDESGPLPGVNILLEGSNIGAETDFDGNFKFPKKLKKGDILIFSFVGMESQKVVITNKNTASKIEMKVDMKMTSCILLGKVAVKKVYNSKK